ncbi:MAG: hypothetical protein H7257_14655 [Taibaiella sp.]|nr:hypothetical protein [Taibaiella sp.]
MTINQFRFVAVIGCLGFGIVSFTCFAQRYDTISQFEIPIELDSVVVKTGFDPSAFIRRVKNDTTFYKAFKSMHLVPFTSENRFTALTKGGGVTGTLHTIVKQSITQPKKCRITNTTLQQSTGDFFKRNGAFRYYTAELFYNLFFSSIPVCNEHDIVAGSIVKPAGGRMEQSKFELKQLIFNPGSKVQGIPLMGDKASIFDEDEVPKYTFKIRDEMFDSVECIVFSIAPKPQYKNKVVYNELTTWFRRTDYSILARNYSLSYSNILYSFDVNMKVRTAEISNKLYPTSIKYSGFWHVITKKPEYMNVEVNIIY